MTDALLSAKQQLIEQLTTRTIKISTPAQDLEMFVASNCWLRVVPGQDIANRDIPLPHPEPFSMSAVFLEQGAETTNVQSPYQVDCWVAYGEFELRLGDGPWIPMRQGDTWSMTKNQLHSYRNIKQRSYLACTFTPPLSGGSPQPLT